MKQSTCETVAYTLDEAAKHTGVSLPKMRELTMLPGFPAFRLGRRWIIPRDALIRWLNERAAERAEL